MSGLQSEVKIKELITHPIFDSPYSTLKVLLQDTADVQTAASRQLRRQSTPHTASRSLGWK